MALYNSSKKKSRARQRRLRKIKAIASLVFMFVLVVALAVGIFAIIKQDKDKNKDIAKNTSKEESQIEEIDTSKDFSLVQTNVFTATRFFYYGTHFNYDASIPVSSLVNIPATSDIKSISTRVYKITDVALSTAVTESIADYIIKEDQILIQGDDYIDEGLNLEQVPAGEFVILIAVTDTYGNTYLYPLQDESGNEPLLYYSLTKNGKNLKMDIKNAVVKDDNGKSMTTFTISSEETVLPEGIYDIVIDPGHGTADGGAESPEDYVDENGKRYNERDIALSYAKDLKKELEEMGYKVKLTRDGSEGNGEENEVNGHNGWRWCYWHAFEDGNRVWNVCESKAKYSVSLHLNTAANMKRTRGVEVFSSIRAGSRLSALLVENITRDTNIPISGKNDSNDPEHPGVYKKRLDSDPSVDYLYMIREVAGVVTGAMDKEYFVYKGESYGGNSHRKDNYGPEAYLIEMAYISDKENLDVILTQQDRYVGAIAKSLHTDILNLQGIAEEE